MILKHSGLPDNFFELERCETFGDYSRLYGDQIAEKFEDLNIIYIPYFPLDFDLEFIQSINFPDSLPKPGIVNGLDQSVIGRSEEGFFVDENHLLHKISGDTKLAVYLQNQIFSVNCQIKEAIRILFPRYHSLQQGNNTWRCTNIVGDGLHFDYYLNNQDEPFRLKEENKLYQKIKLFINIDIEPRVWWTSFSLPDFLTYNKHSLPDTLSDDINLLNTFIERSGILHKCNYHVVKYPTLSAIMVHTEAVSHHIQYGNRVVAAQFKCSSKDMLDSQKLIYKKLPYWLSDNEYSIKKIN